MNLIIFLTYFFELFRRVLSEGYFKFIKNVSEIIRFFTNTNPELFSGKIFYLLLKKSSDWKFIRLKLWK